MNSHQLTPRERFNQAVWSYIIYPVFPWFERNLNFLHKIKRQPYHLGWIAPGKTIDDLKNHLSKEWGFGNHFVAWTDSDEVLSWRKLDGFRYQFHVRVFKDGEIRAHYELTPEAAPVLHFRAVGQEPRAEDFMKFLGPILTTTEHISCIEPQRSYEQISFTPHDASKTVTYKTPKFLAFIMEKAKLPRFKTRVN